MSINRTDSVREWARVAAEAAQAKGGENTVVLEVGDILAITDAFVITSGTNRRMVAAIVDEVEARLKTECDRSPLRAEGLKDGAWALLDYGDFVVHVFSEEARAYYDLERLWADAPRLDLVTASPPASA